MAYFERKRILALSGLTTNKARDIVLRIIIEYSSLKGFCTRPPLPRAKTRVNLIVVYSVKRSYLHMPQIAGLGCAYRIGSC
jgi:hypothetical protein